MGSFDTQGRHVLDWTFDYFGGPQASARCLSDPGDFCRSEPDPEVCSCDAYGVIGRDDRGWYHTPYVEYPDDSDVRHYHRPAESCNYVNWLNDDPVETIMEASRFGTSLSLGVTPIEVEWDGNGYMWSRVSDTTD